MANHDFVSPQGPSAVRVEGADASQGVQAGDFAEVSFTQSEFEANFCKYIFLIQYLIIKSENYDWIAASKAPEEVGVSLLELSVASSLLEHQPPQDEVEEIQRNAAEEMIVEEQEDLSNQQGEVANPGGVVLERKTVTFFDCGLCKFRCSEKLNIDCRQLILDDFSKLTDWTQQSNFLLSCS